MKKLHPVFAIALAVNLLADSSYVNAHSPPEPQINWVHSPQTAMSLAREFRLPILVYVTSDSCYYCRKMENETWRNSQIVSMVGTGFVPLELHAKRDEETVSVLGVRAFPATLLFSAEAEYVTGAPGYLPPKKLAGLLRSAQPSRAATERVTQAK